MDSDTQTRLAQYQDTEQAARIVRSIAAIEADVAYAWGPLSERLLREASGVAAKAIPEQWTVTGVDDWSLKVGHPSWKATRGVGQDAWLELSDIGDDDEAEHSWVFTMISSPPAKLGLELKFRPGLVPIAEALTSKDKVLNNLTREGFAHHNNRISIGIAIDPEKLAQAFLENDFDNALAPIGQAVETATKAKADLDALIDFVRTKGR